MSVDPCGKVKLIGSALGILVLVLEYGLGKTKKLKPNSVLDLIITLILTVSMTAVIIWKGRKNDGSNGNSES